MRPLGAYTTKHTKSNPKIIEICCKKCQKLMLSKLPKSQNTLENLGPEANCEKMAMKPKHIDLLIWKQSWSHFGLILGLGSPLEAI